MIRIDNKLSLLLVLLASILAIITAEIDVQTGLECVDQDDQCPLWATLGECKTNRTFMNEKCRKSCDRCRVMRVNSHQEMQEFMAQKKAEIIQKKQERKAQQVLQGKEL
jgi:ShK domain-like